MLVRLGCGVKQKIPINEINRVLRQLRKECMLVNNSYITIRRYSAQNCVMQLFRWIICLLDAHFLTPALNRVTRSYNHASRRVFALKIALSYNKARISTIIFHRVSVSVFYYYTLFTKDQIRKMQEHNSFSYTSCKMKMKSG